MDDSKMLWCLAHSLDIVARSHVELGTIAPAEIFARKALELSETGLLRFGLGPGADADWVTLRVPSSLTTLARVYCGLNKLAAARLYVRRAVEYSREIFHCSPLPQTANKFACALHWYEELLAQLRVGEDNDLSELCSLEDWKALSAHLRISKKWPIYSYVAEKVQVLNGLQ
ncbi:hypothetical protein DL93DRAFT_1099571 [Clavulina sp. PMI_390]|nr:hypothetical protein DL93DRAFT_1099571 [Clavulina sp. PMI_390]